MKCSFETFIYWKFLPSVTNFMKPLKLKTIDILLYYFIILFYYNR